MTVLNKLQTRASLHCHFLCISSQHPRKQMYACMFPNHFAKDRTERTPAISNAMNHHLSLLPGSQGHHFARPLSLWLFQVMTHRNLYNWMVMICWSVLRVPHHPHHSTRVNYSWARQCTPVILAPRRLRQMTLSLRQA